MSDYLFATNRCFNALRWRYVWAICTVMGLDAAMPGVALAHGGPLHRRVTWSDWNWDPVAVIVLGAVAWCYLLGLYRLWQRAGSGRVVRRSQAGCFMAGWLVLALSVLSPLDPLSDQLGAAHMVQHMLLMTLAAPLIVWGAPAYVMLWGMDPYWRRVLTHGRRRLFEYHAPLHWLWQPLFIWFMYFAVLWVWHLPLLYGAALTNPVVHDLQHMLFFAVSILFWRVVLDPLSHKRISPGLGTLFLFTTTLQATILGVFMTLSPVVWYPGYEGRTAMWGYTALEDQQLAGLIMWMPACAVYLFVAMLLLVRVLSAGEVAMGERSAAARQMQLNVGSHV